MLFQELTLAKPDKLNDSLYTRFMELSGTDRVRQSHHFAGRFENTYIEESDIPAITSLLNLVKQQAGQLLGVSTDKLKAGFWFNAMQAGQRTSPHHHDENDELLSAVYYIRVPEHSGDLVLYCDDRKIMVQPQEGKLVMFAPAVLHEVTVNHSAEMRLSVAMNVGPAVDWFLQDQSSVLLPGEG
jgi:hypothetical protein